MARGDIRIVDHGGHNVVPTIRWQVASGAATTILAGEPTKQGNTANPYAAICATADLTIGTDQPFTGVAAIASTDTAAADGLVDLYLPLAGVVYQQKVVTASLADTDAEVNALVGDALVWSLASSNWRLDTAAGAGANNALVVIGGDAVDNSLKFIVRHDGTFIGRAQV